MHENPYAAPKSCIQADRADESGMPVPAEKSVRFLNLLIDSIVAIGFSVAGMALVLKVSWKPLFWFQENSLFACVLLIHGYYLFTEGLFARTVGKLITGSKVVNEDGDRPSFLRIVARTFARGLPFEAVSFLGADGRGWHDLVSNTYVVKTR